MAWSRERFSYDHEDNAGSDLAAWLLAGCYAGSLIAWFLTAPAARMATFAWWGLAGTLLGLASRTVPQSVFERRRQFVLAGLVVMFLLPMAEQAALVQLRFRADPIRPEYGRPFYVYYPIVLPVGQSGFPPLRVGAIEERTNDLGLKVYLGKPYVDEWPRLVWDSPLPAARYFNPHLKLRRPGDMQSGFMMVAPQTGGAWPPRKP
jgi:hypothetical protein